MPLYRIHPATADHAPAVIDLIHTVFNEYDFIWDPQHEFHDLLAPVFPYTPPHGQLWVLREHPDPADPAADAPIVGSIAADLPEPDTAELHRLYLTQRLRGQGHGRQLLQTALQWARQRHCRQARLWSDTRFTDSHRLYQRLHFQRGPLRTLPNDPNHTQEWRWTLNLRT